jgi:hypothetical protein
LQHYKQILKKEPTMKRLRKLKVPGLLTIAALSVPVSMAYLAIHASQSLANNTTQHVNQGGIVPPRIQLAILLDTSSSMDGLIDQARQQLWQVVNEFSTATRHGIKPSLEVAVFEYGNNGLSASSGYIRKVSALTTELDGVSEALFSLKTNGGNEFCGQVIQSAVDELEWSKSDNDIKAIFIAGNEPFTQGPVPFREAISHAKSKGIVVNTIHAGDHQEGARTGWRDGAVLAGGNFMSIDHNHKVAHITAPQDRKIAELNARLNQTYIPYGAEGKRKLERQKEQDAMSSNVSAGLLAKRTQSKASGYYENSSWDLVDAHENGKVDLESVEEEALPAAMKPMSPTERKDYVVKQSDERKKIKQEIKLLSKKRDSYVAEQRRKLSGENVSTVEDALIDAVRKQGKNKKYQFKTN